jgi:hypothetical protein
MQPVTMRRIKKVKNGVRSQMSTGVVLLVQLNEILGGMVTTSCRGAIRTQSWWLKKMLQVCRTCGTHRVGAP